ncbi:MAG: zinc ribbon domain-containing protein [Acidobacteriota bacterium]|nr:zinc ribbon domain-containing protein [Acidobacteriota bacterium]
MPLYEYECKKCHHRFERIQKFSDRHMKKCPDCGGIVEQTISAPAVQFKGSGWYVTDYAKRPGASASSSNGDSSSKSDSDSKSDSGSKSDSDSKDKSSKSAPSEKSESKSDRKPDQSPKSGGSGKSEDSGKSGKSERPSKSQSSSSRGGRR